MNKHEIDEMMKDLPSQQVQEETLIQKITIGIMFLLFLVFWMWVPNFFLTEEECKIQAPQTVLIGLCTEPKAK